MRETEYCVQHALEGMVDVKSKKCRTEGCGKKPSYRVSGTKTAEYCVQHAPDGMVNVYSKKCGTEGCGKTPVKKGKRGACQQKAATVLPDRTAAT